MRSRWLIARSDTDDIDLNELTSMFDDENENGYIDSSMYDDLMSKGYPIREISYSYGDIMDETELISAEKTNIPDSEFLLPSAYNKTGLMDLLSQAMGG